MNYMLEGDVEDVLPGISLHVVRECHSVAEQLVIVDTARGKFIVVGDIACRPANVFGTDEWPGYPLRCEIALPSRFHAKIAQTELSTWQNVVAHPTYA